MAKLGTCIANGTFDFLTSTVYKIYWLEKRCEMREKIDEQIIPN